MVDVELYTALTGNGSISYVVEMRSKYGERRTGQGDFDHVKRFIEAELLSGGRVKQVTVTNGGEFPSNQGAYSLSDFLQNGDSIVNKLGVR